MYSLSITIFIIVLQLEHDEVKRVLDSLNKAVSDMHNTLQRINAPNMKAMERYVCSVRVSQCTTATLATCINSVCSCFVCHGCV